MTAADQPTTEPSVQAVDAAARALQESDLASGIMTGTARWYKRYATVAVQAAAPILAPGPQPAADTEGLHPDDLRRRLPSITTPLTPDAERDERLREARERAALIRSTYQDGDHLRPGALDDRTVLVLDDEIARLDAVVTAVRKALAGHPRCDQHTDDDPIACGWKRAVADVQSALDGGAR